MAMFEEVEKETCNKVLNKWVFLKNYKTMELIPQ